MKSAFPLAAVVLGILLLLASALWGHLFPPSRTWTEEKSLRLSELGNEAHGLKFALVEARQRLRMHAGRNPAEIREAYDKVREDYDRLHQEFVGASEHPKTAAKILRWSGVALVLGGGAVYLAGRRE